MREVAERVAECRFRRRPAGLISLSTYFKNEQEGHVVELAAEDQNTLDWFVSTGTCQAETSREHKSYLEANEGLSDAQICEHLGCSTGTPYRTKKNLH